MNAGKATARKRHACNLWTMCLFVWFDSLRPSQQFFSYMWTGRHGLNQY